MTQLEDVEASAASVDDLPSHYRDVPLRIEFTPAQLEARAKARRFLEEELLPRESQYPEIAWAPPDVEAELSKLAKDAGLWGIAVPSEFGGQGLGELGYVLVREQIAQSILFDVRDERGVAGDPWPLLYDAATPEQKERYLAPMLTGEKRMFHGLTEPEAGSDLGGMQTNAVWNGSEWVINGHKIFIGKGGLAQFGIVFAVTDEEKRARGGVSAFIVEQSNPGLIHVRDIPTMGAAAPAELKLVDCKVGPDAVLGELGTAFSLAQQTLGHARVRQASLNLAAAQRAMKVMLEWLPTRHTWGVALADREAIRWKVARAAADLRAARLLVYRVALMVDLDMDVRWATPAMKTNAAQMACRVIDLAIQMLGSRGISKDYPLERLYRDVRSLRISEGADEVQRVLISRELLGREPEGGR